MNPYLPSLMHKLRASSCAARASFDCSHSTRIAGASKSFRQETEVPFWSRSHGRAYSLKSRAPCACRRGSRATVVSFEKAACIGNGGGVARSMQHTDNHDFGVRGKIIDGIAAMESDAQSGRELMAFRAGKRKILQAGKGRMDFVE